MWSKQARWVRASACLARDQATRGLAHAVSYGKSLCLVWSDGRHFAELHQGSISKQQDWKLHNIVAVLNAIHDINL